MPEIEIKLRTPDWELLRRQKHILMQAEPGHVMTEQSVELIAGLINLLDHIQDKAADILGTDAVFCEYTAPEELIKRNENDED